MGKGITLLFNTCMLSSSSELNSSALLSLTRPCIFSPWSFGEELHLGGGFCSVWLIYLKSLQDFV